MPFHYHRVLSVALSLTGLLSITTGAFSQDATVAPATKITLIENGVARDIETRARTLRAVLSENQAALGALDRCTLPLDQEVTPGLRAVITRVRIETVTERETIPFATKREFVTTLAAGDVRIVRPGHPGERIAVFRDTYIDGTRVRRTKLSEKVAVAPVPQAVKEGLRGISLASRGAFAGRRILTMVATGYGPGGNGRFGAHTATGMRMGRGVVAVDPRVIPLGTRLFVEGYGLCTAGDTGSVIKGLRIDLGFDSDRAAEQVGRRTVRVVIMN
jgi:3D (Asp-Asp-Asp) domain-containing protein